MSLRLKILIVTLCCFSTRGNAIRTSQSSDFFRWTCSSDKAKFEIKFQAPIPDRTLGHQSHGFNEDGSYNKPNVVGPGFSLGITARAEGGVLTLNLHTERYVVIGTWNPKEECEKQAKEYPEMKKDCSHDRTEAPKFGNTEFKDYKIGPISPLRFEVAGKQFSCEPDKRNANVAKSYRQSTETLDFPNSETVR